MQMDKCRLYSIGYKLIWICVQPKRILVSPGCMETWNHNSSHWSHCIWTLSFQLPHLVHQNGMDSNKPLSKRLIVIKGTHKIEYILAILPKSSGQIVAIHKWAPVMQYFSEAMAMLWLVERMLMQNATFHLWMPECHISRFL